MSAFFCKMRSLYSSAISWCVVPHDDSHMTQLIINGARQIIEQIPLAIFEYTPIPVDFPCEVAVAIIDSPLGSSELSRTKTLFEVRSRNV